ncbi:MAG: DUF4430 domain-containing protein [Oscillospiraceae bacterium]
MKITKKKIILALALIAVLALAFWWGGSAVGLRGAASAPAPSASAEPAAKPSPAPTATEAPAASKPTAPPTAGADAEMIIDKNTGKDKHSAEPAPSDKPLPAEPENTPVGGKAFTCTLSVNCAAILNNMDMLDKEKADLLPAGGIIFPAATVTFCEGESVFDVLARELKKSGIHLEFVNTPIYNSAYIEGIQNIYEFDCGELSGWMYKVNGLFPSYGCSRYQLKQGDLVEWVYTCDLGADVGGAAPVGS